MGPLDYYDKKCQEGIIVQDPQQLAALQVLQRIHDDLISEHQKRSTIVSFFRRPQLVKGTYLWGSVGIGKTLVMDCFYQALPFSEKRRLHFHQFMQRVHHELTGLQGVPNPLQVIAARLAKESMVLCFDEFFVSDIADAMILGGLLKALFAKGVCFVATSNIAPDRLYEHGLQRLQFVPAIELLKIHAEVIHIKNTVDYRLRHLKEAGVFYTPLGRAAEQNMQKTFVLLSKGQVCSEAPLEMNGRLSKVRKRTDHIVWFDFKDICTVPRSQSDYLVIAEKYDTVFISDIPVIPPEDKDTICLFVCLIDVLYDARVKLVISAAEPVTEIYSRGHMVLEYTRTHSRLLEMQSQDYFFDREE
jgi:cell division protein ZapE